MIVLIKPNSYMTFKMRNKKAEKAYVDRFRSLPNNVTLDLKHLGIIPKNDVLFIQVVDDKDEAKRVNGEFRTFVKKQKERMRQMYGDPEAD